MTGSIMQLSMVAIIFAATVAMNVMIYKLGVRKGREKAAAKYDERLRSARGLRGFDRPMPRSSKIAVVRSIDFRNTPEKYDNS